MPQLLLNSGGDYGGTPAITVNQQQQHHQPAHHPPTGTTSFSALTLLVGSFDMTYNVFGGTLSLTQSIYLSL